MITITFGFFLGRINKCLLVINTFPHVSAIPAKCKRNLTLHFSPLFSGFLWWCLFVLSFFQRDVLDEILGCTESVLRVSYPLYHSFLNLISAHLSFSIRKLCLFLFNRTDEATPTTTDSSLIVIIFV